VTILSAHVWVSEEVSDTGKHTLFGEKETGFLAPNTEYTKIHDGSNNGR
jgi:hypothetical protein